MGPQIQIVGMEIPYVRTLFIHPFTGLWLDWRGIQDQIMESKDVDAFENSRQAALAIQNPNQFARHGLRWRELI